jgi:hypothetical protein
VTNTLFLLLVGMNSDTNTNSLKILATPAGIEPATNSLEVVRKSNDFSAHSDRTALPAALFNKPEFQFVGMI